MPTFESPIGNKKIAATALKEFDVPDESQTSNSRVSQQEALDNTARRLAEFQERLRMQQMQQSQVFPDEDIVEVENRIRAEREAKRTGRERLSEGAKKRLEILMGMTRTTRSAEVAGNVFVFQSLQAKEMREAIIAAAQFDGSVQSPFEIRKQFLARSLTDIAGVPFEQFIGSVLLEDKMRFIEELDDALLNRLYDEYLALAKEAREKFAINTEADAQEVVQDLKK